MLLRTAQRWLARYRHDGPIGLARAGRRNADHSRLLADLVTLLDGMALRRPRSSAAAIHRRDTAIAEAQGWRIPSYSTVYAILTRLNPALMTLASTDPQPFETATS
ncbi:DNA-binding domain-containing protein [Methylobacterium indicum]|uniref:DNA-binding domain-containing protein n=1 Tax=Methylobacterium indicum TaxID=1775910 RepID=UPI000F78DCC0|nr:DNA-binding domain-containing protein [Methylobacterium indicum]